MFAQNKTFSRNTPKGFELGFSIAWGAHIDREGTVWVGTRDPGGGIVGLDFKNSKRYFSGNFNNNSAVTYSITEDNAGNIWAIRGGDNILLKKKSFKQIKINEYHVISEIDVTNVKKEHRTILNIKTLSVDDNINDDTFKEINLKRSDKFLN